MKELNQGGSLLISVPAYNFLWSDHDEVCQHFRRYNRSTLLRLCREAGFSIRYSTYFNTLLFPPILSAILFNRFIRRSHVKETDICNVPYWKNTILRSIFSIENLWIGYMSVPVGVSIIVVCEKSY